MNTPHDTITETNVRLAGRAAFEWGFRMAEKGHNLEHALAEFDKVMDDEPTATFVGSLPPHNLKPCPHGQS